MDTGEQFVMIPGLIKMLRLCVSNWDIHMKVRSSSYYYHNSAKAITSRLSP